MDLVAILTANAVAVGIVGYLLRIWVEKRLSHALGKQLVLFKADLAKDVATHSIQGSWNHSKTMELFAHLYEQMIDLDFELKALLLNIKIEKQELVHTRARQFCEKYTQMNACLHKNELFLPSDLIEDIRNSYKVYFDLSIAALRPDANTQQLEQLQASLPDDIAEICSIGDIPRQKAITRFKEIAGIS